MPKLVVSHLFYHSTFIKRIAMNLQKNLHVIFCIFIAVNLQAQKAAKGSSPGNTWGNEVLDGGRLFNFKDAANDQYTDLHFGKWSFESNHPSAQKLNESGVVKNFHPLQMLFNTPQNVAVTFVYYNYIIHVKALAPGKIPFSIHFSFSDSMYEQYSQKTFSSKTENYQSIHFWKKADGYIATSANDSLPFNVLLFYSDEMLQPVSTVIAGTDTIFLQPVFDKNIHGAEKRSAYGSTYDGFDFYKNNLLIGAARRKLDFLIDPKYRYWFSASLKQEEQEAVAAMIYLIVGFIK
jgi:hypothetical protein